jgi:hypothetical protein
MGRQFWWGPEAVERKRLHACCVCVREEKELELLLLDQGRRSPSGCWSGSDPGAAVVTGGSW